MKLVYTLLAFSMLLMACNSTPDKESIEGWASHDDGTFKIQYPPSWELNNKGDMGTSFIIMAPVENDTDQFRENINLLVQDLAGESSTLDDYVNESIHQIGQYISNSEIIDSRRGLDDWGSYHVLKYSGTQGLFNFMFEQQIRIENGTAYILTFASEQENYGDYEVVGEQIMESFEKL